MGRLTLSNQLRGALWRPVFLLAVAALVLGLAAETAKKQTPAAKGAASTKKTSKKRPKSAAKKKQSWRTAQTAPTPERYQQIQEALAQKGYYTGSATGKWDQASVDALKRFQENENLEATGKINSLSLIALGLGPKRETPPAPK